MTTSNAFGGVAARDAERRSEIPKGQAADADPTRRPGVPMEAKPPHKMGNAHWDEPERQPDPGNILKRKGLDELTPVFGTTLPPRGLSGVMRRAAYEIPEHHTSHWFLLLMADKVDVIEHNLDRTLPIVGALAVAGGGLALLASSRKKERSFLDRVLGR